VGCGFSSATLLEHLFQSQGTWCTEMSLTKSSRPRGRALFLEYLPHLRFLDSSHGTLLVIFQNGDACFYAVSDQSKGYSSSEVKILTKDISGLKKLKGIGGIAAPLLLFFC
jgi:hypothetical protein